MGKFKELFNKLDKVKIGVFLLFQIIICLVLIFLTPQYWIEYVLICTIGFIGSIVIFYIPFKAQSSKAQNGYPSFDNTLLIANETLLHLKEGLNEESALVIAKIIKDISDVAAVAITDTNKVLAFIGEGCEKHPVGKPIVTNATKSVLQTGKSKIVNNKQGFNCQDKTCNCPLESAVIVPLINKNTVVGTLKLYQTDKGIIPNYIVKLANGLAQILSMQIELVELEHQAQLTTEAQLDALQAQINPHFLFNALNTVNMYILKDPEYARFLLVRLSTLLRYLLGSSGRFITLKEEVKYIDNYVVIEEARFVGKIRVVFEIDEDTKNCEIPVFTIQPLVNNAILHGVLPKVGAGTIKISAKKIDNDVKITVEDSGIGIPKENILKIFEPRFGTGCGVGISNVNERLKILYGVNHGLNIESEEGKGTKAWFRIPFNTIENKQVIEWN
ncbi:MAG: histidine kinase [Vulcanibacillus sp.]